MNDVIGRFEWEIMDAERIPFAVLAVVLSLIIGLISGPMLGQAKPFVWMLVDKVFGGFGDRLNKSKRPKADLLFRGFMLTSVVLLVMLAVAAGLRHFADNYPYYGITETLFLTLMLSSGAVIFAMTRLYQALEKNKVGEGAYYAIARSTRINLALLDDYGITRAGMGLGVRSFDKAVVAPVFWYLIGGLPLALVYAALAALAWRFGKDGFSGGFGDAVLALERLMGFVPGVLAAFLISMATFFTPTTAIVKGFSSWFGVDGRAPYNQGGLPLSAMAWALNVSLGGAVQDLSGMPIKSEWVGPQGATAKNDHKHLRRALYILLMAHGLFIVVLGGAYMWGNLS